MLSQSTTSGPAVWRYVKIASFDHWSKNVFVLPGTVVAIYAQPDLLEFQALWNLLIALLATGLVASRNYVM